LIANNLITGVPDAKISPRAGQHTMAIDLSLGFEVIMEDNNGWLCRAIATGQEFYASEEDILELCVNIIDLCASITN
jgi:hypothetical protein